MNIGDVVLKYQFNMKVIKILSLWIFIHVTVAEIEFESFQP